jgi:drug/metabolite transporter (DMT)-like permease
MLVAGLGIWGLTLLQRQAGSTLRRLKEQRQALLHLLGGTISGPVIGVSLSLTAIQLAHVGVASTLMALPPIFMLPIGYFLLHERFGWQATLGTLVAMAGVALLFLV